MTDWPTKLQQVADFYNAALATEQECERALAHAREMRIQAYGKAQAVQELFEEHLEEESVAAASNGQGDAEAIAPVRTGKAK